MADESTVLERPDWLVALNDDYQASVACAFLLHGATHDYVGARKTGDLTLRDFLLVTFAPRFDVVTYSPGEGITFQGPMAVAKRARERFERVMTGGAPQPPPDPDRDFLRGQQPQQQSQGMDLPKTPGGAIPLLFDFLEQATADDNPDGRKVVVIVDRLDLIVPPADKGVMPDGKLALLDLFHRIGTNYELDGNGNILIMLTPDLEGVHADLRNSSSGIRAIEVTPPTFEQRLDYLQVLLQRKSSVVDFDLGISQAELAAQTAGLGRRHIEDLVLRAIKNDGKLTLEMVRERKSQQIAAEYAEVLEIMETDVTLDMVGGHDATKRYLRDWVIAPMLDEELREFTPLGLLFIGPAGTGKTFMAKAVARETGLNAVLLRADKIKGSLVGESERRLAKALQGIEALAPCLVFLDEIDQKIRRTEAGAGDGGSAVEMNLFGRLLEFFGDTSHRGRIVCVAASNRPDLVDAALKRPGRFDTKIPFFPPDNAAERADVLQRLLKRFGLTDGLDQNTVDTIAETTDNYTQAELERLVVMARGISRIGRTNINAALVGAHARLKASTADIQRQTAIALAECDDLELVPERWRSSVGKAADAPAEKGDGADFGQRQRGSRERSLDF